MKTSRQYVIEQIVANIIINFGIAYYLGSNAMGELATVPLIAPQDAPLDPNMAGDIMVGSLIMGVILTLILTWLTRAKLRKGGVEAMVVEDMGIIGKLPRNSFLRALTVGLVAMFTLGLVVVLLMALLGISQLPSMTYIVFHAFYVAVLAGVIAWATSKRALADS